MFRLPYIDPYLEPELPARGECLRALFLDRDGVINVDAGYVHRADQVQWREGIRTLLASAWALGLMPIIVTNQAGIARGYYTESDFLSFTAWLHAQFRSWGSPVLATFYCPHHPTAGLGEYRCDCACRKPRSGMLEAACRHWAIDRPNSVLVGDKASDVDAARSAGIGHAFLLDAPTPSKKVPYPRRAMHLADVERALHDLSAPWSTGDK